MTASVSVACDSTRHAPARERRSRAADQLGRTASPPSRIHEPRRTVSDNNNVQKGSGTIWTFDDELARLSNGQIVPDPFWTLRIATKQQINTTTTIHPRVPNPTWRRNDHPGLRVLWTGLHPKASSETHPNVNRLASS